MNRLKNLPTLKIDPGRSIAFTYRGRRLSGYAGDTVAGALYANGVRIFSRSLKYHRPRGLYCLDGESSNCLMTVDGLPNVHTERTLLREGMHVRPQNVLGTPEWDFWGLLDHLHWAMPAGYYYRVFHKPYRLWPFFQERIRKMAGLGRFNPDWQPGACDEIRLNADVCVLGGGPAGLSAALGAAELGLRVVLLEARPWLGGCYAWRAGNGNEHGPLYERADRLASKLAHYPNARIFTQACISGLWGDNLVTAFQVDGERESFSECYMEVRARSVVVATGCSERPLIFENNERPGVMQVACAHRLARSYGILPGTSAVFSVGDDLGLEAAADLADLGLEVLCVADCRTEGHDGAWVAALKERSIRFLPGWAASRARGGKTVSAVELASLNGPGKKILECDLLVASAGLTTNSGPLFVGQAKMKHDPHTGLFIPQELPPRVHAAGRVLGHTAPKAIELSGRVAGLAAAADCGLAAEQELCDAQAGLIAMPGLAAASKILTARRIGSGSHSFVCFDEDVTVKHLEQSSRAGFDVPELAKRYTAAGTGPSQGGIPGHNLPLLMAELRDSGEGEIQPTTIRPPLVPTQLSTLAGRNHDIFKCTPLHEEQQALDAIFRRIGVWKRARYFSSDFSSRKEIRNVRENVGMIDVSTLGKFRLFGPDAAKALDRVYVGDMTKIPTEKVKYSAMVNDDGCLLDDGVVTRVGASDYYFTTSTGRAAVTSEWIRYHCRYDNWNFHLVNLTDALGAINLAGPNARAVLQKLTEADLSPDALPFMGFKEIVLNGQVTAKVMRLGFVGELSFELHVPASACRSVWRWLMEAGREFDIRPFGLEAQNVLRLEKGHVIIGQESEIRTTLHDLNLGFLWHREKAEAKTVGAPALKFTEHQEGRLKLVGLCMEEPSRTPADGSLIVDESIRGYICTARFSHTLEASVGLALVDAPLARLGTRLKIFQDGMGDERLEAVVVPTPFYDPEGKRLRM